MRHLIKATLLGALLGAAALATPATASAKPTTARSARPPAAHKDAATYRKEKHYDFEADNVNGDIVRPEGDVSVSRRDVQHANLIRLRQEFVGEIVKSANDL